jgi:hypothetical protein
VQYVYSPGPYFSQPKTVFLTTQDKKKIEKDEHWNVIHIKWTTQKLKNKSSELKITGKKLHKTIKCGHIRKIIANFRNQN